jgi:hypothetical protein
MKGYKASYNGKCRDQHYEVGKTYELWPFWKFWKYPKICERGFHFCQNPDDVLEYYDIYHKDFVLFEVEALGKIDEWMDKTCTDRIKIIRVIPKSEYNKVFRRHSFVVDENDKIVKWNEYTNLCIKEYNENGAWIGYTNYYGVTFKLIDGQWVVVEKE